MFVYIFFHVHPVGVGADLSCPHPRTPTKWRCIFPSLILQYIIPYPRTPIKWRCNFPPLALQYLIPHPRNSTKWRCNSHHFDTSKPFGSDCKTGAMNRPLRLTVCSLPYICVINEYCGMFVDIYAQ